jgi:hypothetical protein
MRTMRIVIVGATLVAAVQLLTAGANAGVSYDPVTNEGFIGRGDVIALVGKSALRPSPAVLARFRMNWVLDCTYADGSSQRVEASSDGIVLMVAETRRAVNGTITGYVLPGVVLESTVLTRPDQLCLEADGAGAAPAGFDIVSEERVELGIWFNGVQIPD